MGYFDALANACFKKTTDGKWTFYPYGILGRGYVVPSEAEYDRLHRNYKSIMVVTLLLIIAAIWSIFIPFPYQLISLSLLVVFIIFYMVWARAQCHNLAPASEKLTYKEALSNETRSLSSGILWILEILSILLILYGVLLFFLVPSQRLFGAVLVVVFIFCTAVYARMIRNKRRQTNPKQ